jgi:hypothetical protein
MNTIDMTAELAALVWGTRGLLVAAALALLAAPGLPHALRRWRPKAERHRFRQIGLDPAEAELSGGRASLPASHGPRLCRRRLGWSLALPKGLLMTLGHSMPWLHRLYLDSLGVNR